MTARWYIWTISRRIFYEQIHKWTDRIQPTEKEIRSLWRLDTNTVTVTHFNADTQTEEIKTYNTDFIRYHFHFSDSHCPDRLRRLVNEGKIELYLDDMELKVSEAITRQVELWKQTDSCYQKAVISGDTEKMLGLENCFVYMAREAVFECMVCLLYTSPSPRDA